MRIKITAGGIYGLPTTENPSGELAVGTELTVEKAPEGWAGRYIDLDETKPTKAEDIGALTDRNAELEAEVERLKALVPAAPLKAEHHGGGKFNITQGETVLSSGLSKVDADAFNAMTDTEKAEFVKARA